MHLPCTSWRKISSNLCIMICSLFVLSACISGSSPAIKFYVLNPTSEAVNTNNRSNQLHVEIKTVRLPQYLERPQIVTRSGTNQILLSETSQWGGNLRKNMTRTLAINLSHMLATPNIAITPYRGVAQPDFRVEVEVIKFEKGSDNMVYLHAQWRVSASKNTRILVTQISDLHSEPLNSQENYEETVESMAKLYAQLSQLIASKILELANP